MSEAMTIGELFDKVRACKTDEEAATFMQFYRKENEHADENIGYLIGYMGDEDRTIYYKRFNLVHPIFNTRV